jgi:hypothetical protein
VSRLSRQCGILNISQPYRPPRPVTGIALLYFTLLTLHHQNAGQNHNIELGSRSFDNMVEFRYFRLTVTYQNLIREKLRSRLILLMLSVIQFRTFYHVCCIIILPVILYGCGTWSHIKTRILTEGLWEQGAAEDIWTEDGWVRGGWIKLRIRVIICRPCHILSEQSNEEEWDGHGM